MKDTVVSELLIILQEELDETEKKLNEYPSHQNLMEYSVKKACLEIVYGYIKDKLESSIRVFSIVLVEHSIGNSLVSVQWIQDHIGTIESAKQKARDTLIVNYGKIVIAVTEKLSNQYTSYIVMPLYTTKEG